MAARAWMSWSSGKDSAAALHAARQDPSLDVVALLVTVNAAVDRVSMHGVRRTLLEAQAQRLGLPLHVVEIPDPCANGVYERCMADAMNRAWEDGIEAVVFGDPFLEDVRAYSEKALSETGIAAVFPLWGSPTDVLASRIIDDGIRAVLTCLDAEKLSSAFVGRAYDGTLLSEVPPGVDPCGEHGEFHTFVWDGPDFTHPIDIEVGEIVTRGRFVYADVVQQRRRATLPDLDPDALRREIDELIDPAL